jgi:hypothetical protein
MVENTNYDIETHYSGGSFNLFQDKTTKRGTYMDRCHDDCVYFDAAKSLKLYMFWTDQASKSEHVEIIRLWRVD